MEDGSVTIVLADDHLVGRNELRMREALRAAAKGYVLKQSAGAGLVQAIRAAAGGGTWLNPELGARMAAAPAAPSGPPGDLTERELDVLRLIALGHTNIEIAEQLPQRPNGGDPPRTDPAEARHVEPGAAGPVRAQQRPGAPFRAVRDGALIER